MERNFKIVLRNPLEINGRPFHKIIDEKLDIKLRQFKKDGQDAVLEKFTTEQLQALKKYLLKFWRQGNLMTYFFDYAILSVNKTQ